jgi:hypothetical protein
MFQKVKEAVTGARLRAGQILRERKERIEEKRAEKRDMAPSQGAPLIWVWFLAIIAVSTLIGSTWMLVVFIAGSVGTVDWAIDWRAGNDGQPGRWIWYAEATVHLIIGVGLACFCLGIAAFNAVWLHIRHYLHGLFLGVVTALGIATAVFMVAGAIVTQQWGTDARTRDQIANVGTAQAGVAAINAEIASIETEMARLCAPNLTTYQAQACRSGEIAWAERTETARRQNDAQLGGIERAMADARQGDRWRARLLELRQEAAVATVQTVEAETATVVSTGWMATFARVLEDIRKPFIAVLGELLAMTMFGVALAAWRSRQPYKVASRDSGWAPEELQIEDLRADEAIKPQPMKPPREVVTDAETGEELVKITPKPHWRKTKGKKQRVETQPVILPDETGVPHDGGGRVGSAAADEAIPAPPAEINGAGDERTEQKQQRDVEPDLAQTEPSLEDLPELTEEQAAALMAAVEGADDQKNSDDQAARAEYANEQVGEGLMSDGDGEGQADEAQQNAEQGAATDDANQVADQNDTPITDERRMIAANVAAE